MGAKCVFRVQPLEAKGSKKCSVASSLYHQDNHLESADTSRPNMQNYFVKSCKEKYQSYADVQKLLKELRDKHNTAADKHNANLQPGEKKRRHFKDGAKQCIEVVMSFSPDAEKDINPQEWAKAQFKFIIDEYLAKGCELIRLECHRDEKTMHCHAIVACWDEKTQSASANNILGDMYDLSRLQTKYAEAMAPFGLERGRKYLEEYDLIRKSAFKEQGITKRPKDKQVEYKIIANYCKAHNIPFPKRKYNMSYKKFKYQVQELFTKLEHVENDVKLKEQISKSLSEDVDIDNIFQRLKEADANKQLLEVSKDLNVTLDNGIQLSVFDWLQDELYYTNKDKSLADRVLDDEWLDNDLNDNDTMTYSHGLDNDDPEH